MKWEAGLVTGTASRVFKVLVKRFKKTRLEKAK